MIRLIRSQTRQQAVGLLAYFIVVLVVMIGGCSFYKSKAEKHPLSQTPAIQSQSGPISEQDLGVPLYPHAAADQNQSFVIQGKTTSVSLSTTDSVDQVEQFYREKLGSSAQITEHQSANGKLVDIFLARRDGQVRMQIVPQANGTGSVIVILTQFHKL